MASISELQGGIQEREQSIADKQAKIEAIQSSTTLDAYQIDKKTKSLRQSIKRDRQIIDEIQADIRRKEEGKVTIQESDPLRDTPEKADEYGSRIAGGQTREEYVAELEQRKAQEEFIAKNPYGYTSTTGEMFGTTDPNALSPYSNTYLNAGNELRKQRIYREGNFQDREGRVYYVSGLTDPTKPQYSPPPNFQTESGEVARVTYKPYRPEGRWGAERIEPYNPPKTNKVEDYLYNVQQVGENPSFYEQGRASVGFLFSTAYYTGKTITYEVPRAILNPKETIKGYWSFFTSSEARSQTFQNIGYTIKNDPAKAYGTGLGYFLTGKVTKRATGGVQVFDSFMKKNPRARVVTYSALGGVATTYALKNPVDSIINAGSQGMAVFIGKVRKSPLSKVQKSKRSRGVISNPKYSTNQGKFIQKTGRANKDRITLQASKTGKASGQITTENIKVQGRGDSRVKQTTTTRADFSAGKLKQLEQYKSLEFGRGSPRELGGKGFSRPPSQVSTPKGAGDGALIVIQRQQQALKNFQARATKPNLKQLPNKGQYYTGKNQAQVLKEPKAQKLIFNKRTQSYRPQSKREARFQAFKQKLKLKARRRSESRIKNNYGVFYELKSFFKPKSKKDPFSGKPRQLLTQSKNKPLTQREAQDLAVKIKAVDKRPESDVSIIPPNNKKAIRGESVPREIDLNAPVGIASAVLTIRPLAQYENQGFNIKNKARVEVINNQKPELAINPARKLILNRSQVQTQAQGLTYRQTPARATKQTQTLTQEQNQRQRERRVFNIPSFKPISTSKTTTRTRTTKTPPPERIIPRTPLRPPTPSTRRERGFNVLTRRGGVFVRANPLSLARSEALNFGSNLIRGTARASFKIVESGRPVEGSYKPRGTLKGLLKKAGGVYIEPREKRINTRGELEQITFKGLRSRKTRRGRGVLGL